MTEPMKLRVRLPAPVSDVHRALTDPAALRTWFAEHAEVELPRRYEFWGRYTPDGDAPHQRLLHADERTLRFTWRLDGQDTTVTIGLEEEAGHPASTVLTLSHTDLPGWPELITTDSVLGMVHTFWALSVANLADYVSGRELTPRCDFTSPEMRAELLIAAPRDAVFDSLVKPEKFRQWFGANIEIEPYVGGRFAMGSFELDETPAKILELDPGRKLTTDWPGMAVASWELADSGGKTRLTFVQSGFDPANPPYGAWMGWLSGIAELRRFHELEDWRPTWLAVDQPGMPEGLLAL